MTGQRAGRVDNVDGRGDNNTDKTPVITGRGMKALRYKFSSTEMSDARGVTRARLLSRFVGDLARKKFGGIVFSYEDVLYDTSADHSMPLKEISSEIERIQDGGIAVAIVSRGDPKRICSDLRHAIGSRYWESTHVGYENGAVISTLNDDIQDAYHDHADIDRENITDKSLKAFLDYAMTRKIISDKKDAVLYPHQISILRKDRGHCASSITCMMRLDDGQLPSMARGVKAFDAGRHTDIIPYNTSKYDIVRVMKSHIPKDARILCIGSSGQWPGSDCEMLTHRYSLSTDTVSATASSCWNLLAADTHAEQRVLSYLRGIATGGHRFGISL